jgi:hypothetical protein
MRTRSGGQRRPQPEVDIMKLLPILILSLALLPAACKKDAPSTQPEKEPTVTDTKPAGEQKLVPMDHYDTVDNVWQSGFQAVIACVQKRVDVTKQKGIEGYLIIEAKIGKEKNPIDIRIKEQKLDVDQIEPCIVEYIGTLEFPVWGYWATSQKAYTINIGY